MLTLIGALFSAAQAAAPAVLETVDKASDIKAALINAGVAGVCLLALGMYYVKKDRRYEARIDEWFAREREFQEAYANMAEKYRVAMEASTKSLDAVLSILRNWSVK